MPTNCVVVAGRICSDIETRNFPNGGSVTRFRLAHNETWKDGDEKRERAHFFEVEAGGGRGDAIGREFAKGDFFIADGRLCFDQWETDEGVRSKVYIRVQQLNFHKPGKQSGVES